MLANSRITTVLPVVDVQRARRFYEEQLGLQGAEERPLGAVAYHLRGDSTLELSPRAEPARNPYTALSFEVDDLEGEVRDLERRGVRFEDYDEPGLRTVGHVAQLGSDRAAWFKDPDGNILCVHQGSSAVQ